MSSFIFYKLPFEGKIEAVNDLIRTRDWKITLKMPENGTLLMKVPEDIEEEVLFNQDIVFDEKTNSKFGMFSKITESEFESSESLEIPDISASKENTKNEAQKKKSEEIHQEFNTKISLKDDDFDKINDYKGKKSSINEFLKKSLSINLSASINVEDLKKSISGNLKDPYDYFFTKNYLITFFIIAVIILIIFRF
jgi:hypothetical protein